MRILSAILAGIFASISVPAISQEVSRNQFAIGATAGTLGIGGEASYLTYDYLAVRAVVTGMSFNAGEAVSYFGGEPNENYDFDASGLTAGLLFDFHPFADGWRISAGVRYVNFELDSTDNNGADIGANSYSSAEVGTIRTSIRNSNPAAPYLGFGYDAAHYLRDGNRFTLGFEVGALYAGQPDVKIRTTNPVPVPGLADDIALEEQKLKDDLKRYYWFYPVVMLSGKMSF